MSSVKQTLELAEELKARLSYPLTQAYVHGVARSIFRRTLHDDLGPIQTDSNKEGRVFCEKMRTALTMGEFFYLSDEMRSVVEHAAQSLTGTEVFTPEVFPSPFGFLVFEQGRVIIDRGGRKVVVKAMLWAPDSADLPAEDGGPRSVPGKVMYAFGDTQDSRDEALVTARLTEDPKTMSMLDALGRLHLIHMGFIPDGSRIGPATITSDMLDEYGVPFPSENADRFLFSFLLMLRQKITSSRKEVAAPKYARHLAKRHLPSQVTVVLLRRIEGVNRTEGESKIEWGCRWLVRGFYRTQPVSARHPLARPDGSGGYVATIYIHPYVKNSDRVDLPFKTTTVINAMTR